MRVVSVGVAGTSTDSGALASAVPVRLSPVQADAGTKADRNAISPRKAASAYSFFPGLPREVLSIRMLLDV